MRLSPWSSLALAILLGLTSQIRSVTAASEVVSNSEQKPRPARLSDWLYEHKFEENAYLAGLSLRLPQEVPAQSAMRLQLLARVAESERDRRIDRESAQRIREWLSSLPPTGRIRVVSTEARWLRTHPQQDPVLPEGASVLVPVRPRTITVVLADGRQCKVVHRAGYEARAYVSTCLDKGSGADWAWIAQPDGLVQRAGIAIWNATSQDTPAPGAWIWAPARSSRWSQQFSEQLVRFLATQGPAPDASETTPRPSLENAGEASAPGGESPGLSMSLDLGSRRASEPTAMSGAAAGEPLALRADDAPSKSHTLHVSAGDWGNVGLLQTPTARMRPAGALAITYSGVRPYRRVNAFLQPFDWMEAGFRYSYTSDVLGSITETTDKSIDLKFRLWPESAYVPELAVGFRDVAGTGLFSGEYLVASKRAGDFDWSLGLGWGYVGARGDIRNPLSAISRSFDQRQREVGLGGEFSFKSYFRGAAAFFGGVQYQTPWSPLLVKVEYDGNDYRSEPFADRGSNIRQKSPINFGLVYRPLSWLDVTLGYERGNTAMFSVSMHSQLNKLTQPKFLDPAPIPVAAARPTKEPDWALTTRDVERQSSWAVNRLERRESDLRIVIDDAQSTYWRSRIDRVASVLHRDAPAEVDRFTITHRSRGVDVAEHVVDREAWVAQQTTPVPASDKREAVIAQAPQHDGGTAVATAKRPAFSHGLGLHFDYTFGTIDAPVLYRFALTETARLQLRPDLWLQGAASLALFDNFDKWNSEVGSGLPQVRTRIREYVRTSRLNLPNLQITHVGKLGDDHFYSVYAGYLEMMFGGIGGEWLYRPFAGRLALGVDVNAVKQREFDQHFGFLDYKTTTGHATLYWDTGWEDVQARLSAGRYLAGDWGATLQVSRVFKNGISMGAWATKTNVSAATFGEGSFDKGIFLSIPFDAVLPRTTGIIGTAAWRPILRDGGAMLNRAVSLYSRTQLRSDRTLEWEPAPVPNWQKIPEEHIEESMPQAEKRPAEPYTRAGPKTAAIEWEKPGSTRQLQLTEALYAQGFRNIKVDYDPSQRILITLTHADMRPVSRAVGRAARTALLQGPTETRGISITFVEGVTPQVRYEFFDLERLRRYFDGKLKVEELKPFVSVQFLTPAARTREPLAKLDDVDPDVRPRILAAVMPDTLSAGRVVNDFAGAADNATRVDWLRAGAIGAGLLLSTSFLDNRANRFTTDHAGSKWIDRSGRYSDALPIAGALIAGALALDGSDPVRSRTGYAAIEAGATAFAVATGLKYVVGRARPTSGLGRKEFNWLTSDAPYDSFPSRHTAVTWALVTPFALEYDMPWLYGVAALSNVLRVGSREHWVTDTVAGSLIGYGLGRLFWQSGRDQAGGKVYYDGSTLGMMWPW